MEEWIPTQFLHKPLKWSYCPDVGPAFALRSAIMCCAAFLFRIRGNDARSASYWGPKNIGKILNSPFYINPQGPQNRGRFGPLLRIPNFCVSEGPEGRGRGRLTQNVLHAGIWCYVGPKDPHIENTRLPHCTFSLLDMHMYMEVSNGTCLFWGTCSKAYT